MTKAHVLAAGAGREDVADLDIAIGDDDPIDEQFNELTLLLNGGLSSSDLQAGAEGLDGGDLPGECLTLARLGFELTLLLLQWLHPLLELTSPALLLGEGNDRTEGGLCQALELRC